MSDEYLEGGVVFNINKRERLCLLNSLKVHADLLHRAGFYDKLNKEQLDEIVRAWNDCMTMIFLLKEQDKDLERKDMVGEQ